MATTPTNNPIPSEDPRDLKFNAGKIDEEVNGSADYYADRFGVQRLTNTGRDNQFHDAQNQRESDFQQFLLNSGYQFLGDYENGPYEITTRNQIIRYQNEFWRLNAATNPPYTTTGINSTSWTTDVTHLVSVGDATLRQELSSNVTPGADLVSLKNGKVTDAIYYATPDMFGAVGDGVADDYQAIQDMFDAGAPGCVFEFDGSKTYYNAFGNKTKADLWVPLEDRNELKPPSNCTIKFNGAKFTRRFPFWNENNAVNNMNSGTYYTDDHTAIMRISNADGITIYGANFNGGIPIGTLVNTAGTPTTQTNYAVGECMDFGLIIENSSNIKIRDSFFTNCVFPVYVDGVSNFDFQGEVHYAAQAAKRVTPTDLAYGGGLKILNSTNARIDLYGTRNVNTTAEIESLNSNVQIKGWSNLDYSNSLVIFGSQHVHIEWTARNVVNGVGAYIRGGFTAMQTNAIAGNIIVDNASFYGCYIYLAASASTDIFGINLNVQTLNCGSHGLYINAESGSGKIIDGVNINHQSYGDDGGSSGTGAPTRINGLVKGEVRINPSNAYQGFWASGNNSADTKCVVRVSGNIRGATNRWTITSTMRVDIDLINNTNHYRLSSTQFVDFGAIVAGGGFDNTNSYTRFYGRFFQPNNTYPLFPTMKATISGSAFEVVYDSASGTVVPGGHTYPVKLFVPT